jgi:hypothetical protein
MKEIQTFSEGNPSKTGRESKETRKEIQAFVFRELSLINDLTTIPARFLIWAASGP